MEEDSGDSSQQQDDPFVRSNDCAQSLGDDCDNDCDDCGCTNDEDDDDDDDEDCGRGEALGVEIPISTNGDVW